MRQTVITMSSYSKYSNIDWHLFSFENFQSWFSKFARSFALCLLPDSQLSLHTLRLCRVSAEDKRNMLDTKPFRLGRHSNWILKAENCQTLELCINDVSRSVKRSLAWQVKGLSVAKVKGQRKTMAIRRTQRLHGTHSLDRQDRRDTAHCPLAAY